MADIWQDVFLSHATHDKETYINPLAAALAQRSVTFWIDSAAIAWGDNVTTKLNEGLRNSRYALICLSAHFLERPWPEQELSGALSLQNTDGRKRVLPLILNSKERVLQLYPLLAGMSYREFTVGPATIADEIRKLLDRSNVKTPSDALHISVVSVHTGITANLLVTPQHSLQWVLSKASAGLGLRTEADAGAFEPFHIRWVLVDVEAEGEWLRMPRSEQVTLYAVLMTEKGVFKATDNHLSMGTIGLRKETVAHLYPVADHLFDIKGSAACIVPNI